jgi:hypothetical protein
MQRRADSAEADWRDALADQEELLRALKAIVLLLDAAAEWPGVKARLREIGETAIAKAEGRS